MHVWLQINFSILVYLKVKSCHKIKVSYEYKNNRIEFIWFSVKWISSHLLEREIQKLVDCPTKDMTQTNKYGRNQSPLTGQQNVLYNQYDYLNIS